jgi:hypothetical protein
MARPHRFDPEDELHRRRSWERPVTLRLAAVADYEVLDRLAQRDCRPLPPGPHLVAEREGRIEAAVSLASAELVADPFRRTAELCELLRCHAGELRVAAEPTPAATIRPRPELVAA